MTPRTPNPTRARAARLFGLAASMALCLALADTAPARSEQAKTREGWIPLFNGKDLEGWTPKIRGYASGENYADTFRVEDGILKVSYAEYPGFDGKFGHLFSKAKYGKYRLRIEYRFVGDQCRGGPGWAFRNSGVMIHSQSPESMRKDQDFPVSIEVQFLGGGETGRRPTGNVCTPGTHIVMGGKLVTQHCNDSRSDTYRGDRWVTAEVEVHGDGLIRHFIDGKPVIEYEKPQLDPNDDDARALMKDGDKRLREGYIALQAESHPVEFRRVEILPLEE